MLQAMTTGCAARRLGCVNLATVLNAAASLTVSQHCKRLMSPARVGDGGGLRAVLGRGEDYVSSRLCCSRFLTVCHSRAGHAALTPRGFLRTVPVLLLLLLLLLLLMSPPSTAAPPPAQPLADLSGRTFALKYAGASTLPAGAYWHTKMWLAMPGSS